MKTNKILITGANGFVGQQFCKYLVQKGYDILPTVRSKRERTGEIDFLQVGDLTDSVDWIPLLKEVDVVVHLAGRAHVLKEGSTNPLESYRAVNTIPTIKLGEESLVSQVKRFIFVSTIGVNGSATNSTPFKYSDPDSPNSDYARSKQEAEAGLKKIFKATTTELVILRPPLIYGQDAPGNISLLIRYLRLGIPLPFDCIQNKRSFLALKNFIDILEICVHHPKAANRTLLISDGLSISTSDFIRLIAKEHNIKPRLFKAPSYIFNLLFKLVQKEDTFSSLFGDLEIDSEETFKLLKWYPKSNPLKNIK